MYERDLALEPFDTMIGTWITEATHPLVDAVVSGTITDDAVVVLEDALAGRAGRGCGGRVGP